MTNPSVEISENKTVILAGPTASGKTEYALKIAEQLDAEIISADSRQIYQKLNIGTGKPTSKELETIRHHMVSSIPPTDIMTADRYALEAQQIMKEIHQRGQTCLVVGGTGLWIRALIDGLAKLPPANEAYRQHLKSKAQEKGKEYLYNKLLIVDPTTAKRLHPSDQLRVIRALEIHHYSGIPASQLKAATMKKNNQSALWFGIERSRTDLYQRAEQRIDLWREQGWCEEVQTLISQGVSSETPALQAIGYSHIVKQLQGEYSCDRCFELIKRDTRRYIKRQLTWFRAEKRICWITPETDVKHLF